MLNDFAARVRHALLSAMPELAAALSETDSGDLLLTVPHPTIPTGLLATTRGGELSIGFREWHTHGDLLGGPSQREQIAAGVDLIRRILASEITLVISERDGSFADAWVTDDPAKESEYQQADEVLRIGTWSELAAPPGAEP